MSLVLWLGAPGSEKGANCVRGDVVETTTRHIKLFISVAEIGWSRIKKLDCAMGTKLSEIKINPQPGSARALVIICVEAARYCGTSLVSILAYGTLLFQRLPSYHRPKPLNGPCLSHQNFDVLFKVLGKFQNPRQNRVLRSLIMNLNSLLCFYVVTVVIFGFEPLGVVAFGPGTLL
jgi:hypothetical protein